MTIQECYEKLNGDFEATLSRLRNEALVERFAMKFLDDGSYELLETSMKDGNVEDAFRAAHTLKGVCQNLGFDRLFKSSSNVTEALRGGNMESAKLMMPEVEEDYKITVEALEQFKAEK